MVETMWSQIIEGQKLVTDLKGFRNTYGEDVLTALIVRALQHTRDVRKAGLLIGAISNSDDKQAYDNFRAWMTRLGIRKSDVVRDLEPRGQT